MHCDSLVTARRYRSIIAGVLCVVLLPGCAIMRFGMFKAGKLPVPAEYVPNKVPTVVFVIDLPDPAGVSVQSDEIAAMVEQQLQAYEIAPTVPSEKVSELRSARLGEFSRLSAVEVGKAVGAKQVLRIQITRLDMDSQTAQNVVKGKMSAKVAFIDVDKPEVLWPNNESGVTVSHETPYLQLSDANRRDTIQRSMNAALATKIVTLFRTYTPQ